MFRFDYLDSRIRCRYVCWQPEGLEIVIDIGYTQDVPARRTAAVVLDSHLKTNRDDANKLVS